MKVSVIQERLKSYQCRSTLEEQQALREITQEIVLAALSRTDFFRRAAFQGGTCLRIFHGLERFSEDLDFALEAPDPAFDLADYLQVTARELSAYGYDLEIDDRSKGERAVRTAFIKDDSLGRVLQLGYRPDTGPARKLKVRLEVDTNPPAGATTEMQYLDFPFPSAIRVFDPPSLLAGKFHALLCREYLKGRDWYDFAWFTARRIAVNYALLGSALSQMGPWRGEELQVDRGWCTATLREKIAATDWAVAREDVRRFLKPGQVQTLVHWNREFFLARAERLA
jgi:predicted nucleotidyltransferase component of viral defense system